MVFLVLFQFGLWRTSEGVLFPFVASSVQSVLRSVWVFCKWYVHCPSEPSIAVCGQLSRVVGIVCINTACYCGDNFSLCYCQPITVSALSLAEALFTLRYRNLKTTISLWKRIKCFPFTLHWRNLKTRSLPVSLDLCLRKTRAGKSYGYWKSNA